MKIKFILEISETSTPNNCPENIYLFFSVIKYDQRLVFYSISRFK